MHLKRIAAPKSWPIKRKGTKYIALPKGSIKNSVPLIVVVRDVLKITRNKKETKRALQSGYIKINNKIIRDEKFPLKLFDILTIVPSSLHYKINIGKKGKFKIEEIKLDLNSKISKIVNKTILKGKKIQINLNDGRNYLSDLNCRPGDSVLIDLERNKIEKIIPFEENKEAVIILGKNSGEKGRILKIDNEKNKIKFLLENQNKEIEIRKNSIMVLK